MKERGGREEKRKARWGIEARMQMRWRGEVSGTPLRKEKCKERMKRLEILHIRNSQWKTGAKKKVQKKTGKKDGGKKRKKFQVNYSCTRQMDTGMAKKEVWEWCASLSFPQHSELEKRKREEHERRSWVREGGRRNGIMGGVCVRLPRRTPKGTWILGKIREAPFYKKMSLIVKDIVSEGAVCKEK